MSLLEIINFFKKILVWPTVLKLFPKYVWINHVNCERALTKKALAIKSGKYTQALAQAQAQAQKVSKLNLNPSSGAIVEFGLNVHIFPCGQQGLMSNICRRGNLSRRPSKFWLCNLSLPFQKDIYVKVGNTYVSECILTPVQFLKFKK